MGKMVDATACEVKAKRALQINDLSLLARNIRVAFSR